MSVYEAGVNDPEAVKVWGQGSMSQALHQTSLSRLRGSNGSAFVRMFDELETGKGDRYRHFLRMQDAGLGVPEGVPLEGNEDGMEFVHDDVLIGQFRKAVRIPTKGNISVQRVPFQLRDEAKSQAADWVLNVHEEILWNHACGYTPANSATYADIRRGYNTVVEYDANHRILAGSGNTNDEDLGSSDKFTLSLLRRAITHAQTMETPLLPGRYGDKHFGWVCALHPYQSRDLREDDAEFWDLMTSAIQGGHVDDNPLFTGALGVAEGVLFIQNKRVTQGVNSSTGDPISTVRRATLMGANAFMCGYAKNSSRVDKLRWIEKLKDYDNELGIGLSFTYGFKRTIFDGETYGALSLPTYAAAS